MPSKNPSLQLRFGSLDRTFARTILRWRAMRYVVTRTAEEQPWYDYLFDNQHPDSGVIVCSDTRTVQFVDERRQHDTGRR